MEHMVRSMEWPKQINIFKLIILLLMLCIITNPVQAQTEQIEQYLTSLVEKDIFSGTVLIAENNKIVLNKGYGSSNREEENKNTPLTRYRIGSLTKQFTAFAIVMLQQRGKLNVSDQIYKYLPNCPPAWELITIKHLLTHTSGITNFTESPDVTKGMSSPLTVPQIVDRFKNKKLEFNPGYMFSYSNSNYILLGQIIENVSGMTYQAFLQENIFDPLGMQNTGYDNHSEIIKHRARGYSKSNQDIINAPHIDMTIPFAAGGLYSTVEDLYLWEQSLYTEKLISKTLMNEIFTPEKGGYGYGWYITEHLHKKLICHGGWISGFAASIARYPTERVTIIALSNIDAAPVNTIARNVAGMLFKKETEQPRLTLPLSKPNPLSYDKYIGEYQITPNVIVTLTKQGTKLTCHATGFATMELLPESEENFFITEVGAQITFLKDDKGVITSCKIYIDEKTLIAKKIK